MHEPESSAEKLLDKYRLGKCTEHELALLEQWYLSLSNEGAILKESEACTDLIDLQTRLSRVATSSNRKIKYYRMMAAAAILVFISMGTWFWTYYQDRQRDQLLFEIANKIQPGKYQAVLTFDGQNDLLLGHEQIGSIITEDAIILPDRSSISTRGKNRKAHVVTPNAGQFNFTLPDGSKVWLNSASSIQYPTQFDGNSRMVEITGEVFFEIERDVKKPFIVKTKNQLIEVLGTQFNVDAYGDFGQISTTLVQGSLSVMNVTSNARIILNPGEQVTTDFGNEMLVQKVDTESFSSWKDGVYVITNQSLSHFGKQIERWYDVEIDMGRYRDQKLSAMIRRDVTLAEVLNAIELKTQIKFKIEGRRVTVVN